MTNTNETRITKALGDSLRRDDMVPRATTPATLKPAVKRYQINAGTARTCHAVFTFRRAQRAVRLAKHFGLDAYVAGAIMVRP